MTRPIRNPEVEKAELIRMLELQRFAEFGRLSAHLIHEVANPLTAAALHLELLGKDQSETVKQIRKSIRQLELYVNAARKQLKAASQPQLFSVKDEVRQSLAVLLPIAKRANVKISMLPISGQQRLYGDPIKFNQVFANLVVNAIDSYVELSGTDKPRCVTVELAVNDESLELRVHDWAKGISAEQMAKIFELFYTTKIDSPRGLGIGLSLVKQYVEQDFGGSIKASSSEARGTEFVVRFKLLTEVYFSDININATSGQPPAFQPVA
jgi:signal transduction histidine kinase